MDIHIVHSVLPDYQPCRGGPFTPAALTQAAYRQLREQAESLAARGRPPAGIAVALTQAAELWRVRGADLPSVAARILAEIGSAIPPNTIPLLQQIRRACALASWLYRYPAVPVAGLIVDSAEAILIADCEIKEIPCL